MRVMQLLLAARASSLSDALLGMLTVAALGFCAYGLFWVLRDIFRFLGKLFKFLFNGSTRMAMRREIIIKDTHRGLRYLDGRLVDVLQAGRYILRDRGWRGKGALEEIVLVDVRQRDLTIKGQEILTADKVAIRVSIITQFQVIDPTSALHNVENYEDRLYSDVQLAARRSLASMNLEEILTNRNRLSEDISQDVTESAASYGVSILRADVKDLIFPGNLQEIMNRVLTAERMSQAQLVEARTKAQQARIEANSKSEIARQASEAEREASLLNARAQAEAARIQAQSESENLALREREAQLMTQNPALLRMRELETLSALAQNAEARIYIGFDKHAEMKNS